MERVTCATRKQASVRLGLDVFLGTGLDDDLGGKLVLEDEFERYPDRREGLIVEAVARKPGPALPKLHLPGGLSRRELPQGSTLVLAPACPEVH